MPVKAPTSTRRTVCNPKTRIQDDPGLASRYLAGQLSTSELQAYEQHLLDNPDAVAELEATARMKVGLANLRDAGQLEPAARADAASILDAGAGARRFRGPRFHCCRTLARPRQAARCNTGRCGERAGRRSGRPLASGPSYALLRTRSSAYDALIELPIRRATRDRAARASRNASAALRRCSLSDPFGRLRHADR